MHKSRARDAAETNFRHEGNKAAVWAPSFAAVADLNLTKRCCYFNYCILVSQCILKPVFSPHTGSGTGGQDSGDICERSEFNDCLDFLKCTTVLKYKIKL